MNIENKILLSEDKQIPNELFGELEHPTNGQNVNQLCKLEGYAFSTNSDEVEVKIFCDKVMVFEAINGMPRFDIYKKYENSEKAYRSGFLAHLYLNDFSEGDHNITAIVHVGRQEKEIGLCKIHLKKHQTYGQVYVLTVIQTRDSQEDFRMWFKYTKTFVK